MVKRTLDNPYKGINAHLHSLAQNPTKHNPTIWTAIHASHIGHIIDYLNNNLPMNYVARPEQSLQIWTEDSQSEEPPRIPQPREKTRSPRPDVSVYRTSISDSHIELEGNNAPVRVIAINPFLEEEITILSAVIYEVRDHEIEGRPVTRIELLSASNKRGGRGEDGYRKNRLEAIRSGTSLIELDYLHQSASTLPHITPYPYGDDSHPYYIALTDCRAGFPDEMRVYIRDVNQALPSKIAIPLAGEDSLIFDFEAVYQHTFRIGRWGIHIDYEQLPRNFGSYSENDQQIVLRIMDNITMENDRTAMSSHSKDAEQIVEQVEVELSSGRYLVRKYRSKTIKVFHIDTGRDADNTKAMLRKIIFELELGVDLLNSTGTKKITRQLGDHVIKKLIAKGY
ncbi:MAG: DUF4058 family protein [Anaerolineae bacterium]|nr:DUF4058 family protein [Anaerolineae bacterium]